MKNNVTRIVFLILASLLIITPVMASEGDIESALESIGVSDPQATIDSGEILITGGSIFPPDSPWESVIYRFATVIATAHKASGNNSVITLEVTFEDGNIMRITGNGEQAQDFLDGASSLEEFESSLVFTPVTRGPILVPGICEVDQGDSCATNDACSCYPNETCRPGDANANPKGCIVDTIPANADYSGGQYVCIEGYVWNAEGTSCVKPQTCDDGEFPFQGVCYADTSDTSDPDSGSRTTPNDGISPWRTLTWLCMGLLCLAIPVVIIILVIRRSKKNKQAVSANAPSPQPVQQSQQPYLQPAQPRPTPPPVSQADPRFQQLEQRFAELTRAYRAGQLTPQAYQAAAQQLVIQDARGHWSISSGQWLWFDGRQWLPRDPYGR